jgi:hypothetical protein
MVSLTALSIFPAFTSFRPSVLPAFSDTDITDGLEDQDTEDVVCLYYLIIHRIQPSLQVSVSSSTVDISDATNWVEDFDIPDENVYVDELADYLAQPLERTKVNPLQWWWEKRKVWPRLSQMALDYLCIPGTLYIQHVVASLKAFITATSTSVEQLFSQGRHLLVFTRNRLLGQTIRKFLCFGGWSKRDLVRTDNIAVAITKTMGVCGQEFKGKRVWADKEEEGISKKV